MPDTTLSGQKTGKLFDIFDKPTYEAWKAAASETLNGAPFEKKLCTNTIEGIILKPIYNTEDVEVGEEFPGQGSLLRGAYASGYAAEGWQIAQEMPYGTAEDFNKAILQDLSHGQTALNILLDIATQKGMDPAEAKNCEVGACGLSLSSVEDLQKAFQGIVWQAVPVYWQLGVAGIPVLALFAAYLKKNKIDPKKIRGSFDVSPLGVLLRAGRLPVSLESAYDEMASIILWSKKEMPQMGVLGVQGNAYTDAGANAAQELSYVLAATVEYIQAMDKRGIEPKDLLGRTRWIFSVGPNFFTEVAKFRAARFLWANLLTAYGLKPQDFPPRFHARTGLYHKTIYDLHNNILRATMEGFSAALGGVESMHVGPFDEILREPNVFSRRIARNTHIILREECNLDRLVDPAGGSYYVEALTRELSGKAWTLFQDLQKAGGMEKAMENGELQRQISATVAERQKRFSQRRDVLVGTNLYAVAKETPERGISSDYTVIHKARSQQTQVYRSSGITKQDEEILKKLGKILSAKGKPSAVLVELAAQAAAAGATLGEIARGLHAGDGSPKEITPLRAGRLAFAYEKLRGVAHEKNPKVFLATMGLPRQHKARGDFIRAFCEAGGVEVIYPAGFSTVAEAAQAAEKSGAKVAVICSTDETYPALVPDFCQLLKAAAPQIKIYMAGAPMPEHEASYKAAGLDDFIFVKSNHLETLQKIISLYT